MGFAERIPRIFVALVIIGAMVYGVRTSFTEGMKTVIASQPAAPKMADMPRFDIGGCDLGLTFPGGRRRARPCNVEPYTPPAPPKLTGMSKQDSQKATLFFFLSAFGLPLALGGAAALGLWAFRR